MLKLKSLALVAALLANAGPALADNIIIDDFAFTPGLPVTVSAPAYSGLAGQFAGLLKGNPFLTYSTDLLQSFEFDVLYPDYSVVDGVAAWGAQKSQDLERAISNFILFGNPTDNVQSAVTQTIIWEILYENPINGYDFASGSFTAISGDGAVQALLNGVNWAALPLQQVTHSVDQLYSLEHQDFLVVNNRVPEPGSAMLLLAGMAFVARRRQR